MNQPGPSTLADRTPVLRRFGESHWFADNDLLTLACAADGTVWSVEEPGVLRHWGADGRALAKHSLSDIETLWCFDPQLRWLASGADELVIYDVADPRKRRTLEQPSWVTAIAFHPTERRVATGHDDGVVRIWNLDDSDDFVEWVRHDQPISALAFTSDGALLAAASEDRAISLWRVADGEHLRLLKGHTDRIPALAWQPGTRLLVSAGWDTTARLWNVDTGEPIILLNTHADQVYALAFSPNGQLLAVADSAATIHIWRDIARGQEMHVLPGDRDEVRALAFAHDGRRLFVGGADRVIHAWDAIDGKLIAGHGSQADHRIALAPGGRGGLLISTGTGSRLQCWDIADGSAVPPDGLVPKPIAVAASPDGHWIAVTNAQPDSRLHIWDAAERKLRPPAEGPRAPMTDLAFSPDSRTLASCCRTDGTAWLWNPIDGEPKLIIPEATEGCSVEAIVFHPNNIWLACGGIDWLATGGSDGAVSIWNTETRERLMTFEGGAHSLAFDADGQRLAVAAPGSAVRVLDVAAQQVALEIAGPGAELRAVTFSPDGRWLVAGGDDHTVRIWDSATGQSAAVAELDSPIRAVRFSRDGATLFTGHGNTTCLALRFTDLFV